jgi:uncharacterized phage infection (PIP) family protein YhgE
MAAAIGKAQCVTCGKEKVAYKCEGCSQKFCFNHLADHRQVLGKQLDDIEDRRNLFRETLNGQKTNPQEHPLIQQINKWERDSIKKIRQTAEEVREILITHSTENINKIEVKLAHLTEQLRQTRDENDVDEAILNDFKQNLRKLEEEHIKLPNVSIKEDSSSFIKKISVVISSGMCIHHS